MSKRALSGSRMSQEYSREEDPLYEDEVYQSDNSKYKKPRESEVHSPTIRKMVPHTSNFL